MSRFLALTGSPVFAKNLSLALASHEVQLIEPHAVRAPADVLSLNHGGAIDVLVVGPDIDPAQWFDLASGLEIAHPGLVVVLAADPAPEVTLAALRSGIRDVLDPALETRDLVVALEKAANTAAARRSLAVPAEAQETHPHGRVVSVMSPKGGVGKTTVATNLALGLARVAPKGAVIVDLDLQFGDVGSGLGLEPAHTITDAVQGAAAADAMVLKSYLTPHPSGVYALCAPLHPAEADLIKPADVAALVHQLSLEFPFVILDTSPGLGEVVLTVLELATDAVWVCGMDIPSIRGLNHGLEVLRQLDLMPDTSTMVVNFADKRSGLSVKDIESTVGLPVEVVLPHSRAVPFTTNAGVPILQAGRRDPVTKGLGVLVSKIVAGPTPTSTRNSRRRVALS